MKKLASLFLMFSFFVVQNIFAITNAGMLELAKEFETVMSENGYKEAFKENILNLNKDERNEFVEFIKKSFGRMDEQSFRECYLNKNICKELLSSDNKLKEVVFKKNLIENQIRNHLNSNFSELIKKHGVVKVKDFFSKVPELINKNIVLHEFWAKILFSWLLNENFEGNKEELINLYNDALEFLNQFYEEIFGKEFCLEDF